MVNFLHSFGSRLATAITLCIAIITLPAPARADLSESGLNATLPLVVMIETAQSQGAGIVFAVDDGYVYIATMFHVVRKEVDGGAKPDQLFSDLKVRFHQRPLTALPAEHHDEASAGDDLAVIRVRVAGLNFNFARQGKFKLGLKSHAIGYPAGKRWGVAYGDGPISDITANFVEVDSVFIKPGHSGGALIDPDGRILGLVKGTDGTLARALRIDRALEILSRTFKLPVQLTDDSQPTLTAGTPRLNQKDQAYYVWIPPGTFRMGCSEQPEKDQECDSDEFPAHDVTIGQGFWLGQTEVTVGAYERFRAAQNAAQLPTVDSFGRKINTAAGDPQLPAVAVTWDEAQAYCFWAGDGGLRLPTEAEWEYAARAGSRQKRYGPLNSIAWYGDNSGKPLDSAKLWLQVGKDATKYGERLKANGNGPHPVKDRLKNAWNLYDMLGNVWEWTADWYQPDYYKNSPEADPKGPEPAKERVLRGASWYIVPGSVRVSYRSRVGPSYRSSDIGFRCAGEFR